MTSSPMDLESSAFKYALQNAIQFNGKANPGAIIGKILAENPEAKSEAKKVAMLANSAAKKVNAMSIEEQKKELESIDPKLLEKKKGEKKGLANLKNAEEGKVITRIPPEPSKYAHVGHALSFLINYLYAKKYNGKTYVRFEDTNPSLSKKEYVDAILEDLEYLEIKPDKVHFVSDDIEDMYNAATKLVEQKLAYVCFCDRESMQELRQKGKECEHRNSESLDNWNKMLDRKFDDGAAVLRVKLDMESKNMVLRDPVIFRISREEHYKHKSKYVVWPLYDFENAYEDGSQKITHIMRSIEFGGMRVELQDWIKDKLKLSNQTVVQYGRFNITGAISQGREIREKINSGEYSGWDDPRLVTIKSMKRRGIQPETFREMVIDVGLSTTPTNLDFTMVAAINRKILDEKCDRYFLIDDPVEIKVEGASKQEVALKLHPNKESRDRKFKIDDKFLVSKRDLDAMKKPVRLMEAINIKKEGDKIVEDESGNSKALEKIHWLPANDFIDVKVIMPDNSIIDAKAEKLVSKLKIGDIVQFTRFGFCRLDSKGIFIYCHK